VLRGCSSSQTPYTFVRDTKAITGK